MTTPKAAVTVRQQLAALRAAQGMASQTPRLRLQAAATAPLAPLPAVPVSDLRSGLLALVDRQYLIRPEYSDQQMRAVQDGAHPVIREFARLFIRRMARKFGVPLFAHNMVRDEAAQRALYVQGVTKAPAGESPHNYGCAVDIVHCRLAWGLAKESWTMLGHIGKELAHQNGWKLVWGGDFKSIYDPAHWELEGWRFLSGGFPFSGG